MCGIFAIFGRSCEQPHCNGYTDNKLPAMHKKETLRELAYRSSGAQRHRGPDKTGVVHFKDDLVVLIHERLKIVGVQNGDQPLQTADKNITLVANGEIYNYLDISKELSDFYHEKYVARSDCDVIIGLYEKYGDDLVHHMTGMFAFALYDRKNKKILVARDPIGIIPLYIGEDATGSIWIASEMKCLSEKCIHIQTFPPGTIKKIFTVKLYWIVNFS